MADLVVPPRAHWSCRWGLEVVVGFGQVDEYLPKMRDFRFRKTFSMFAMALLGAEGVKMRVGTFAWGWAGERGRADE